RFEAIHGLIRPMQQLIGIPAVVGVERLADSGADMRVVTFYPIGQRDALPDRVRYTAYRQGIWHARQNYDEFIAAIAANDIVGAHSGGNTSSHGDQELVSGGMSILVVDGLEAV